MDRIRSQYEEAQQYLAGGVSASTRVNRAIGRPMLFDRAEGCRVWDLDGKEYIDLCCSHGATLLGHGDQRVRAAVDSAMARGAACSYENELQSTLARLLCETVPCFERVRLTGSGSEATMHCLRLARAFTGRNKILKFEGHFHGYHDQVMFTTNTPTEHLGPEEAPTAWPSSSGLPQNLADHLVIVPFNRADLLDAALARHGREIAAVICEPVYYNAGCILPTPEFLKTLERAPREHGALLIFDEVLSAFRMCPGGAQEYLGVVPDLCTVGKAVGGGFPLSAFGGRQEIMQCLMPQGDCQHSGTYSGHPTAVAAAIAAVTACREQDFYDHIGTVSRRLSTGLNDVFARHGVAGRVEALGARFGIYFGVDGHIRGYRDALRHDRRAMLRFIACAIRQGVYFHDYGGAACHHGFCAAMTLNDVEECRARLDLAVREMSQA